jgi:cytochrome oxidase Cu insertion factor (SCO1/SenC/PrrC family)
MGVEEMRPQRHRIQYIDLVQSDIRWRISGAAIGVILLLAATAYTESTASVSTGGLIGAVYTPPVPAADFTLVDQHGTPFHMADMEGKVVVFSFLYTHCTDVCPYISLKVKAAHGMLGPDAARVGFVAVTTDPQRDTPQVIARYSRETGLFDIWHFVTGTLKDVRVVWSRYLANATASSEQPVGAGKDSSGGEGTGWGASSDAVEHGQGLGADDLSLAARIISSFGGGYEVAHFAAFHIIDKHGKIRVTLDQDALPSEIVSNVRILIAEP